MLYRKIYLTEITKCSVGEDAFFEIYLNDKDPELNLEPRLPMIVVPGGGYDWVSFREAEPIALRYLAEGFNCFVLHYTCKTRYPLPHIELSVLFDYIKKNAKELNVSVDHISLSGFSAGGHLISSFALVHKELEKMLGFDEDYLKPQVLVLGYPVTSLILGTNSRTRFNISGDDEVLVNKLSVPENVTEEYPSTFIFTTEVDTCVPTEHSYMLIRELEKKGVKTKLMVFKNGDHGGSLFNRNVFNPDCDFDFFKENRTWFEESVKFIYSVK